MKTIKGKELEQLCIERMDVHYRKGEAHQVRYGVQTSRFDGKVVELKSLPDFDGVLPGGRQFVYDAKVCSQSAFALATENARKKRQFRHLLRRGWFGGITFLLLHWNPRELKSLTYEAETFAFPVHPDHVFWERFAAGEEKSITRGQCESYAVRVPWNRLAGERKDRPDILHGIQGVSELLDGCAAHV